MLLFKTNWRKESEKVSFCVDISLCTMLSYSVKKLWLGMGRTMCGKHVLKSKLTQWIYEYYCICGITCINIVNCEFFFVCYVTIHNKCKAGFVMNDLGKIHNVTHT